MGFPASTASIEIRRRIPRAPLLGPCLLAAACTGERAEAGDPLEDIFFHVTEGPAGPVEAADVRTAGPGAAA